VKNDNISIHCCHFIIKHTMQTLCFLANEIQHAFLMACKLRNKSDCNYPSIIVCTYSIQNCNMQSFIVYLNGAASNSGYGTQQMRKGFLWGNLNQGQSGKPKCKREDHIKICLHSTGWEGVDHIHLTQDRKQ
jgi:hypothetical protein